MAGTWIRVEKRAVIVERDGGRCAYCGASIRTVAQGAAQGDAAHLDHLVPRSWYERRSRRVNNAATNLVATCPHCNESRGDTPLGTWCREVSRRRLGEGATASAIEALGAQIEKSTRARARRVLPKAA